MNNLTINYLNLIKFKLNIQIKINKIKQKFKNQQKIFKVKRITNKINVLFVEKYLIIHG